MLRNLSGMLRFDQPRAGDFPRDACQLFSIVTFTQGSKVEQHEIASTLVPIDECNAAVRASKGVTGVDITMYNGLTLTCDGMPCCSTSYHEIAGHFIQRDVSTHCLNEELLR